MSVVCDPKHQFGQPIIEGTNIMSETIYQLFLAHEPPDFIAELYEIPVDKVLKAVKFHSAAA